MPGIPEVGEQLDGFQVLERLHAGGMGVLFRVAAPVDPGYPLLMKIPRLGYGEPAEAVVS
jgi:hypothetical protein